MDQYDVYVIWHMDIVGKENAVRPVIVRDMLPCARAHIRRRFDVKLWWGNVQQVTQPQVPRMDLLACQRGNVTLYTYRAIGCSNVVVHGRCNTYMSPYIHARRSYSDCMRGCAISSASAAWRSSNSVP